MERITHTILTIVEPLRDKMRSRKGLQWQSPQQYLKGYVNKEEVHALLQFAKNAMKRESDKEVNNFENLSISDKESS